MPEDAKDRLFKRDVQYASVRMTFNGVGALHARTNQPFTFSNEQMRRVDSSSSGIEGKISGLIHARFIRMP